MVLAKSARHVALHERPGAARPLLMAVALVAPLRFGLDAAALGGGNFAVAIIAATIYLVVTFSATHATAANYAERLPPPLAPPGGAPPDGGAAGDGGAARGEGAPTARGGGSGGCDWMVDQLRATNDVAPRSAVAAALSGGISLHVEHHLFPFISSAALPAVAPVVAAFAARHGLPYHQHAAPWNLLASHAEFISRPLPLSDLSLYSDREAAHAVSQPSSCDDTAESVAVALRDSGRGSPAGGP